MGAARKLKSETAGSKDKKAVAKPADYFKKVKIKMDEAVHVVYMFFRSARRCFYYCKGPRRTGNSWWIDSGRDNAYRRIGAVTVKRAIQIEAKITAAFFDRKTPVKAEPETAKVEANEYQADYKIRCPSVLETETPAYAEDKISVSAVEVHFSNDNKREVKIENVEIIKGEPPVVGWDAPKVKPDMISVPETKSDEIKAVPVKADKIEVTESVGETYVPEKSSMKKEKIHPPKGTEAKKPEVHAPRITMPAPCRIKVEELKIPKNKIYTEKTLVKISELPAPKAKPAKQSDIGIETKPFAFLAVSIKAAKMKPEEIRTSELKVPETGADRTAVKEEVDYRVLKGSRQKIHGQKVASAADSLS